MKKILISTGGTGGHVMPALTLYDHYKESFDTYIASDKRGLKFINTDKYPCNIIDTPQILKNKFMLPINLILLILTIFSSFFFLKKFKIDLLISTGGYMSLPLCLAAKIMNIKIILFEPNMVLGNSNKLFLKYACKIICYSTDLKNFPEIFRDKIYLINSLLRKKIYSKINNNQKKEDDIFKILIIGGSQGAKFFDKKISNLIIGINKKIKIFVIHQVVDKKNFAEIKNNYDQNNIDNFLFEFDTEIYDKFDDIDLAITRSGASTLSELVALRIPFIAVPLPKSKDNHQYFNAKHFEDKNLCWLINQNEFESDEIEKFINSLLNNKKEILLKKENMSKFSYQNTWNNVNQKLINLINEN